MANFIILNANELNKMNGGCYWRGPNIPSSMPVFPFTIKLVK